MPSQFVSTPFDSITHTIIGSAMSVHRELGPGLREGSYQRALANRLSVAGLTFQSQKLYAVYDDPNQQQLIGYYIPDFLVAGNVIVEIKALRAMDNTHVAQVVGYLSVTGCPVGLLINFGERSLRFRRIFPPQKVMDHQVINRQWLFIPDWLKANSSS
jgi:GxxExxY protein